MILRLSCTLIIFFSAVAAALSQEKTLTPTQFHQWMYSAGDTIDYRWTEPVYIKQMNEKAKRCLELYPRDVSSHFVFAYTVHAARWLNAGKFDLQLLDSIGKEIGKFQSVQPSKNADFFNSMAYCYNIMYVMYMQVNDLKSADRMLELDELALLDAGKLIEKQTRNYYENIFKLIGLYNNRAMLLYRSTHHLDSKSKRAAAGPVIGMLLDKADSLSTIYIQNSKIEKTHAVRLVQIQANRYLVFGGYCQDSLRAENSLKRAKEYISLYCSDTSAIYCRNSDSFLRSAKYWVRFARQEYAMAIQEGRSYYDYILNLDRSYPDKVFNSHLQSDLLFALTDSYFRIGKRDSAYYFGELFLKDTTNTKDYSFMSEISSLMAEMSLPNDVNKAKSFLKLSRDCIRRTQSEQIRSKLIREGEIVLINQSQERILDVQQMIQEKEETRNAITMALLVFGFTISFGLSIFLIYRIKHHRPVPKAL